MGRGGWNWREPDCGPHMTQVEDRRGLSGVR
jgi:hypothetical protein